MLEDALFIKTKSGTCSTVLPKITLDFASHHKGDINTKWRQL